MPANLHLVCGADDFLVEQKARAIVDAGVPVAERALGLEVLDGRVDSADAAVEVLRKCIEAVLTIGFFGGAKLVWLKNATFLNPQVRPGDNDGVKARVICGEFWGKTGPVDGVAAEPRYLDVSVPAGRKKRLKVEDYRQAFAYVFEGSGDFAGASEPFGVLREAEAGGKDLLVRDPVGNRSLVVFGAGDEIVVQAGEEGVRFLLVSGRPLREPIAWHGPIVMNTDADIRQAMLDLRNGTFIRS